ncbi:hypothetical protein [Klebsiella pneumoniae]|uniref:hypothetical protein n=1 Tax=Klebsiella pneumoniae TaxID=573 RepID=UPI00210E482B|nr:hypothetical protein [Klebsiella pneumoniae]MBK2699679.1 hypothetical protein [Klebsiella pneumoniae]MBK2725705.1 hypothetical protein [Klebsiella pneumoniae]MCQ3960207.1 hypothetical protein [Klebsiella pneumoniae]HBR5012849.1 hypothetical protein [Klebsiella pneumoniae]HBU5820660.1 hypothetical protein [Klebsiella pneumoniae]
MFTAFNERNDFSYAFEKIRNAISAPGENNLYAATELGKVIFTIAFLVRTAMRWSTGAMRQSRCLWKHYAA